MKRIVQNTATDETERLLMLAEAMTETARGESPGKAIERQEERGQRQIVNSDVLPNSDGDPFSKGEWRAPFEALGIVFGDVVAGDPLFVEVELPPGWSRKASGHTMYSYLVDQRGEERVSVFYKAAFYDRKADMHVIALCATCIHSRNAHPYQGRAVEATAANGWTGVDAPTPCTREGCSCADFARAA